MQDPARHLIEQVGALHTHMHAPRCLHFKKRRGVAMPAHPATGLFASAARRADWHRPSQLCIAELRSPPTPTFPAASHHRSYSLLLQVADLNALAELGKVYQDSLALSATLRNVSSFRLQQDKVLGRGSLAVVQEGESDKRVLIGIKEAETAGRGGEGGFVSRAKGVVRRSG